MNAPVANRKTNLLLKFFGVFLLLLAGANGLIIRGFGWNEASLMVVGGLFMLLFTPEVIDDERVRLLKFKAITWGYAAGILGILLYEVLRRSLGSVGWPGLSAYDSLIVVTVLALGLFRFWRWQDGRGPS